MNADVTGRQIPNHEGARRSQLFLLRVWLHGQADEDDWYGKVQDAVTGEAHPFHGLDELKRLINEMMRPGRPDRFEE